MGASVTKDNFSFIFPANLKRLFTNIEVNNIVLVLNQ